MTVGYVILFYCMALYLDFRCIVEKKNTLSGNIYNKPFILYGVMVPFLKIHSQRKQVYFSFQIGPLYLC